MSYILEALQKSEKERKQDETPILQKIHAPRQVAPAGRNIFLLKPLRWILILLIFFALALGITIWQGRLSVIQPEQRHTDHTERQVPPQLPENPVINNSLSEQQPTERLQQKKTRSSSQTESRLPPGKTTAQDPDNSGAIIQEPAPLTLTQGKDDDIIDRKVSDLHALTELPPLVQADIQMMKFAGHVYSDDRTRRMIMINNKILREGDGIDTDFRLESITRNGVILLYKSTRFRVDLF